MSSKAIFDEAANHQHTSTCVIHTPEKVSLHQGRILGPSGKVTVSYCLPLCDNSVTSFVSYIIFLRELFLNSEIVLLKSENYNLTFL